MSIAKAMKLFVCLLAAFAILVPATAWAGTDGQYTPLAMNPGSAGAVCTLEIATGVGALVWEIRRKQDGYIKCGDCADYCVRYSMHCPHYAWRTGCLKKHVPQCFN